MKRNTKKKSYHFCFSRWSRKSYSAFVSMHKVVKIGVLSVGLSLITLGKQSASAQQTDTLSNRAAATATLDESLVVGQRADALPNMVRVLSVLSERQIELAPAQSLNDLLRYLPSVDIRQRGPVGVQADISIRGGSFEQTQILLNGVNFSDPQTGHYGLDLPISIGAVSKLEVLQGLSAPGAIGGALNISTDTGLGNQAKLNLTGGQYGYLDISAEASLAHKKFQSYLSASHQRSDGYTTNTDFNITNAFAFLRYSAKALGTLETQLGYQQKAYGANGFYSFKYPNQLDATRTFLGSIRWQKELGMLKLSAIGYHRQHFDRFELFRTNPDSWYTGHNYHQALSSGAELNALLQTAIGLTTLAAELRNEHIYSNTLGYDMGTPRKAPFEKDVYYTKHANRDIARIFASQSIELGKLAVTGGASLHSNSSFGSKLCLAADTRYTLTKYAIVYAAANQSLRLPTFTDLFYQTATHEANPDLHPEEATTYELGGKYLKAGTKLGLSGFYRQGKNIIDWVYMEGESKSKSLNYDELNTMGIELSYQWLPSFRNPNSIIQRLGFAYSYTHASKASRKNESSYTFDQLKHKLNVDVEHTVGFNKLRAQWRLSLFERNGSYVSATTGNTEEYTPTCLVNLRLQWAEKRYRIFAEAINLFGVSYYDYGGIIQPKQWLSAGIALQVN